MPTENRSSNTEQMVSVPRELLERLDLGKNTAVALTALPELRELLAKPPEQPQGEPVEVLGYSVKGNRYAIRLTKTEILELYEGYTGDALIELVDRRLLDGRADPAEVERLRAVIEQQKSLIESLRAELVESHSIDAGAEPSAPVMQIPEGYCVMPRRLTAENGAKALLLGEFKLEATQECPECRELDEPIEGCEICDGEGEYGQRHMIPWDTIKFIYSEAVKGLALSSNPAQL